MSKREVEQRHRDEAVRIWNHIIVSGTVQTLAQYLADAESTQPSEPILRAVLADNIRAAAAAVRSACGVSDAAENDAESLRVAALRCRELGNELRKAIESVERDGEWVSCEERMPEPEKLVQVYGGVARWNGHRWFTAIDGNREIQWPVTHWAPLLPAPPQPKGTK